MQETSNFFELKTTYFNTAYLGPTPKRSREKILQVLERGMNPGLTDMQQWFACHDSVRPKLGKLVGVPPENIALSTSVSEVVSHIANGMDLKAEDEVLIMDGDYPSMVLPWMVLSEQRGFKLRLLDLSSFLEPARLARQLSARTKFVGCSHVMFNTGAKLPIAELAETTHKNSDALFMSDTSQSLGGLVLGPDITDHVDILAGVTYKWILGPYGSAYAYFSNRALARVSRTHASWLSSPTSQSHASLLNYTSEPTPGARRFDRGQAPSFLMCAGLDGAIDVLLELGVGNIQEHNKGLVAEFFDALPAGFEVAGPKELRSNIVCVKPPVKSAAEVKQQLTEHGIDAAVREGFLRLSFHFFNSRAQVHRLLEILG